MEKDPKKRIEKQALERFAAVSFIQQHRSSGLSLSECFRLAAQRLWPHRQYTVSTLEQWYYLYVKKGFEALKPRGRSDKGLIRALSPQVCHRLETLRLEYPHLTVRTLVRRLLEEGILQPGEFSLSSIYRYLKAQGLDPSRLRANEGLGEGQGPTKAFESPFANELWMTDMMVGPTLSQEGKGPVRTRLFALLDDCSRLCVHAQYYLTESLHCLLDVLRQAVQSRGIPSKLYSDNGKVFTSHHLKVVCANLDIKLLHAKPRAAWSKGKIEKFFRTLQEDFQQRLTFTPAADLGELNTFLWGWLEGDYHQRTHSALEGQSPAQRFAQRSMGLRLVDQSMELERFFLAETTRRVRRDATFSLEGKLWEVSPSLRGEKVHIHYDPFTFQRVEVYVDGIFSQKAHPVDKTINATWSSNDYESKRSS